jgi:hypothetical protein
LLFLDEVAELLELAVVKAETIRASEGAGQAGNGEGDCPSFASSETA